MDGAAGFLVRRPDGTPIVEVRLPFIDVRVDDKTWDAALDWIERGGHGRPEIPRPATRPAWRRAQYDGGRRLWLIPFVVDPPADGFWVVDLAAGTASFVKPPPGTVAFLIAVSPDKLALAGKDEGGAEQILLFDILERAPRGRTRRPRSRGRLTREDDPARARRHGARARPAGRAQIGHGPSSGVRP